MPKNYCKYFTVSLVPVAALVLVILFAGGIIILPVLYEELTTRTKYGVILDAGSTHTDLYVYEWNIPKDSSKFTSGKIKQTGGSLRCSGSLNSYISQPSHAGDAISDCVNQSYHYVPSSQQNHTEVYLGATAGMRLVNESEPNISDEIMNAVRRKLKSSKYYFKDDKKQAQIIPGRVEAASGWATANYALGNFQPKDHTVGALDMGGASTEIAFQTSATVFPEYQATEKLFGMNYNIYARSYLCYGIVEAERRFLAYLYLENENSTNATIPINNPCKLKGVVKVVSSSYLRNQPCVQGLAALEAFGYDIILPSFLSEDQNISFNGTGDPTQCKQTLNEVFNFSQCSINGTCINGSYIFPPVNGTFVAFSAFYYTADFFIEGVEDMKFTNATLQKELGGKVEDFCGNTPEHNPSLKHPCFKGPYMLHLLENGFGFNSTTPNWELKFKNQVHDITVGWAMGYLLNITSTIPVKPYAFNRPYSSVDLVMGILVLSILCIIFVIFFVLTFQACRKVVKTRSGYTDIA